MLLTPLLMIFTAYSLYVLILVILTKYPPFNQDDYQYHKLCKTFSNSTRDTLSRSLDEPVQEISNNVVCATSKASDQPVHTRSLIRAFVCRLSIL